MAKMIETGEEIVTSVRIDESRVVHAEITVWNRHEHAGVLVVKPDDANDIAGRLIDGTSLSVRDRCYALVQNLAEYQGTDRLAAFDAFEAEALSIAREAGWGK